MRMFRALLGVVVAVAGVVSGVPEAANAAPTAPFTVFTADVGDTGGFPIRDSGVWDAGNSQMSMNAYAGDGFSVYATWAGGLEYVDASMRPPSGQSWRAGQTYPTLPLSDAENGMLNISSSGRGCSDSYGSITVRQVGRDPATQAVISFAASYEFHCERKPEALRGEIRWNSNLDYLAAVPNVSFLEFGTTVEVGATPVTRTVSFTSKGSASEVFGQASLGGADPAQFAITGDTCSGRTIAPGGTCTMTVATRASRSGEIYGNLVLPDNSSYGQRLLPLRYWAFEGVTGMYYPLAPQRLMDTRSGLGAPKAKIGAGQTVELDVAGRGGVPADGVGSVVLNVTVTGPTASSFLAAYPAGESRPNASSINFPAGWLGSNNVTVKVGAAGRVAVYNRSGSTDVVVDVMGFYAGAQSVRNQAGVGGQYGSVNPTRLYDSRTDGGAIPAGSATEIWADFGPDLNGHVRGLVLNVTAVAPARSGFLSVWSGDGPVPTSSTVNYGAGKIVPNLTIVKTRLCTDCGTPTAVPSFAVFTSQSSNVVVDLVGVMDDGKVPDGLRFRSLSPTRILDSRTGLGTAGALGANVTRKITAPSRVVAADTEALVTNVTAVSPTNNTVITVWPADLGLPKPTASNLNPAAGQIVSNAVFTGIGPQDAFNAHNLSGSTHLVADLVGTFWLYPGTASDPAAAKVAATPRFALLESGSRAGTTG
ncbi:choice-of-anchor D domain-containing protein [Micromonospora palomenae]|uniref:choice-of-anchor D domain-containing protein n=1 Tax=Micromonospora palomenae TaxID=1461247 RepID=UPI003F88B906